MGHHRPRSVPSKPQLGILLVGWLSGWAGCVPGPSVNEQVERALARLDTPGRLAALVMVSAGEVTEEQLEERLSELLPLVAGGVGGVWIEGGEAAAIARLAGSLSAPRVTPLLTATEIDAVGAIGAGAADLAWMEQSGMPRESGRRAGREAHAVGLKLGLIPGPPLGGVEASSAIGWERVVQGFGGFVTGAREEGLRLVVQLFWEPAVGGEELTWDRARLEALELPLLESMAGAGLAGVLPGTIALPAVTGDTVPLVFSAAFPGLVRRDTGWEGVVVVDLRPGSGLTQAYGTEEAAVRAVVAGADLLLGVEDAPAVLGALEAARGEGRISEARIEAAARRVLRLQFTSAGRRARAQVSDSVLARMVRSYPASADPAPRMEEAATSAGSVTPGPELREREPAELGMSATALEAADRVVEAALRDSIFTAAALAVGRRDGLVRLRGFGSAGEGAGPVDPEHTLFDLASLTKVVGTTSAVAALVEDGGLPLDALVQGYVPEFQGPGKERVTVRHLLAHTSGLPPGLWLFGSADSPEEALAQVIRQPLRGQPGEQALYSDLGMILLAEVVRRAAGEPIDRLLARRIFAPLGMSATMYLPPLAFQHRTVPSARVAERPFLLRGVVHDGNAYRLGGVTGHAGLFSTARDLAVFAQTMLNDGRRGDAQVLSPETVREFATRQTGAEERALGWDTPGERSSAGVYFSARAFGHTGYTGTSIWIDPEQELFVVLLTNRTLPEATTTAMLRVRMSVHDAIAQAITDRPVTQRPGARR